ncbi:MAG: RagB/SusD family nutrient uptake outer membrane protein [Paludibacter sp.]|nr:RagB/SusD family nutrient uptake outer membrane protein [Paludibacter sp.]
MKNKHIPLLRNTFIVVIAALLFVQCDGFLDLKPITNESTVTAFNKKEDIEAALIGAYNTFYTDYYVWEQILLGDVRSDNAYNPIDDAPLYQYETLQISSMNMNMKVDWTMLYRTIQGCNIVIHYAPLISDPTFTEVRRNEIIAEAKTIRALSYYNIAKLWGGAPVILTVTNSANPDVTNLPRESVQQVYETVIADLQDAMPNLPYINKSGLKDRATRGAVFALLAKVYAQIPYPVTFNKYDKVIQYSDSVLTSPAGYALLANYDNLFDGAHYNNSESIWEIQYNAGPNGNWGPWLTLPPSLNPSTWRKYCIPSQDLVKTFATEATDVRYKASIINEKVTYWFDEYWSVDHNNVIPFMYKWRGTGGIPSSDDTYLVRLADIILLKAEAMCQNGQVDAAITLVNNSTIKRVNGTPIALGLSKEAALDAILKERRLELAFEGQRFDDLVRAGKVKSVMNSLADYTKASATAPKVSIQYNFDDYMILAPIPQEERNRNKQLTQNPGYYPQ